MELVNDDVKKAFYLREDIAILSDEDKVKEWELHLKNLQGFLNLLEKNPYIQTVYRYKKEEKDG